MPDASFTFTRDLLGLPDLVISSDTGSNYVLESFGRPGRTPINSVASSGLVHGEVVVRTRLEQSTIPISCYVTGATTTIVENRLDALEECMSQFYLDVTCDIDGFPRGYAVNASTVTADDGVDAGLVEAHLARVSILLSVYPLAAAA